MSGSLKNEFNWVEDALRLYPERPFVPENIILGQYAFVPWVRSGVGAAVQAPPIGQLRPVIDVAVKVQADGAGDLTAQPKTPLHVRGPGDVLALLEGHVIRMYPAPGTSNAEDSFLAHIEFDRPEIPWLVTPAAPAGAQLPSWLALVVLAEGRYQLAPGPSGHPPQVTTTLSELQPLAGQSWAWAHAQVIPSDHPGTSVAALLSRSHASVNLSRLLCPRHLAPETQYLACVVPAYRAGVEAGCGRPPTSLDPAWVRATNDHDQTVVLPVFVSWRFGTAKAGDFESLAEKLHGFPAPWQVGRRVLDVATPGGGMPPLPPGDPGRLQTVHGPLVSPQAPDPKSHDAVEVAAAHAETAGWPASETEALRTLVNRPDQLASQPLDPAHPAPDRPVIGPELYARYHAAVSKLDPGRDGDWLGQLNLRPEHRVVAGLGTRVVQKDQEKLMQAAWAQVGAIDEANRQLRQAQLARFIGEVTHARHVGPLGYGDLLGVTRAIQSRVLAQPSLTVAGAVADSRLADAAVTPAFRRVTRPLGGLARFAAAHRAELGRLVADGATARDMQRPYQDPDGIAGVSAAGANAVDATLVASVLKVAAGDVPAALVAKGKELSAQPSLPDLLAPDDGASGGPPHPFDLVEQVERWLLDHLKGLLPGESSEPEDESEDEPVHSTAALSLLTMMRRWAGEIGEAATDLAEGLGLRPDDRDAPSGPPGPGTAGSGGGAHGELPAILEAAARADGPAVAQALALIAADMVSHSWPTTPRRPPLHLAPAKMTQLLRPSITVTARIKSRFGAVLPSWLPPDWFDDLLVQPIMAAPIFNRPMYEALADYSRDWLLPGLATFPQPDLVTLLVSNAKFLEAFLVGLSHEMGRELLWRGYPTDQRGTYFRRFWDGTKDELTEQIHRFHRTPLGSHMEPALNDRVVLMVRGELIRRHPDAIVIAMLAGKTKPDGTPVFEDPAHNPGRKVMAPLLFHGHLDPDITLVGFDLTVPEIKAAPNESGAQNGQGWWFVIAEHPTAPRFGLRETPTGSTRRDSLGWNDLPLQFAGPGLPDKGFLDPTKPQRKVFDDDTKVASAMYGADSAAIAHVLLRDPVRAAFEALTLLGPIGVE